MTAEILLENRIPTSLEHRRIGEGQAIVDRLLAQIAASAPSSASVGLFSTDQAMDLYSSRGFAAGDMTGMFRLVEPVPAVQ